ncbi:hypothetical protein DMN77_12635 [Paenibacillus sp. 79R4]|nr:hypothetical protein [Paenibacillus sp. 79R4]
MLKPKNNVRRGWIWVGACFMIMILGSNHLHGYSFLDSFLNAIGIESWATNGKISWHVTSILALPLLLLCFIQSVRYMKMRYPNVAITLFIGSCLFGGLYPKLTEHVVNFSQWLMK